MKNRLVKKGKEKDPTPFDRCAPRLLSVSVVVFALFLA